MLYMFKTRFRSIVCNIEGVVACVVENAHGLREAVNDGTPYLIDCLSVQSWYNLAYLEMFLGPVDIVNKNEDIGLT